MVEVSLGFLIFLEQAAIVLLGLAVFFFLRARRLKAKLKTLSETPPPELAAKPAAAPAPALVDNATLREVGVLREKLAVAEQQVKNLEKFRDLFFNFKDSMDAVLTTQGQIGEQMLQMNLPAAETEQLKQALEKLQREKDTLEQHLHQVEKELDLLLGEEKSPRPPPAETDLGAGVVIAQQREEIGKLIQAIADLEVEAAMTQRVQNSLAAINANADELSMAIDVLQDENQFLTNQVQELLQGTGSSAEEVERLKAELATGQTRFDELQKRYTRLETEYLKTQH